MESSTPQPKKHKVITYTAYAVQTPVPFSNEIVRIRPNPDAPEGMAVFETYNNAQWFVKSFNIPEQYIFPVTIVRSDGKTVVE